MASRMTAVQKQGALALLLLLVCILGWRWRASALGDEEVSLPDSAEESVMGNIETESSISPQPESDFGDKGAPSTVLIELNAADTTALMLVRGIGPVFANRIVKYRKLIGGFQRKEQLQDVYGIDLERYEGIASQVFVDTNSAAYLALSASRRPEPPQIDFETLPTPGFEIRPKDMDPEKGEKAVSIIKVNLNTADSAALVKVKGIGPGTARNIVKYRNLIYFFHSFDQLAEVWGIRPENQEKMVLELTLGQNLDSYPHIELNKAGVEELAKHKYLGFKEAKLIVAYRDQHGPYSSVSDLEKIQGIDKGFWQKLEPYLKF